MNNIRMTNVTGLREVYQVYRDTVGALYFPLDEPVDPWHWFVVFPDGSMGLHETGDEELLTPVQVLEIKFEDVFLGNPENSKD